jgi:hypothetical protein
LHVDRLHGERLALLQAADHIVVHRIIGHAADRETDLVRLLRRLALINDHAGAVSELHAERYGDT